MFRVRGHVIAPKAVTALINNRINKYTTEDLYATINHFPISPTTKPYRGVEQRGHGSGVCVCVAFRVTPKGQRTGSGRKTLTPSGDQVYLVVTGRNVIF